MGADGSEADPSARSAAQVTCSPACRRQRPTPDKCHNVSVDCRLISDRSQRPFVLLCGSVWPGNDPRYLLDHTPRQRAGTGESRTRVGLHKFPPAVTACLASKDRIIVCDRPEGPVYKSRVYGHPGTSGLLAPIVTHSTFPYLLSKSVDLPLVLGGSP